MNVPKTDFTRSWADLVHDDRVEARMYTDPDLFEAEMEQIFDHTWVWVAHASELPEPGDYVTSWLGRQPVIVGRDRKGAVHVLVNRCRHRGATVCESRKGRAASHVCPYHGWSYAQDGSLRGVPYADGYAADFDKAPLGLKSLRTEEYAGLIFATVDPTIEPLSAFLGHARPWIDLFMKQGGGWPVKVLGEHRFRFPGNWKIQLENTTDAYHFPIVHRSWIESLDAQTEATFTFLGGAGKVEDLGNGHSVMVMIPELVDLDEGLDAPIPDRFATLADELMKTHAPQDVRRIVRAVGGTGFNINMFPNIACSGSFFRVLRPVSVEETEIRHVCLGMDGGPEAANRMRMRIHEHFQGPMGFGTPDDSEAWTRVQRGVHGARELPLMVDRGLGLETPSINDLPVGGVSAETGMRAAYRQWKRMMQG